MRADAITNGARNTADTSARPRKTTTRLVDSSLGVGRSNWCQPRMRTCQNDMEHCFSQRRTKSN
eukprot:scaffold1272_cov250-Pinguiococcus_pyrenoidosus.AAC.34